MLSRHSSPSIFRLIALGALALFIASGCKSTPKTDSAKPEAKDKPATADTSSTPKKKSGLFSGWGREKTSTSDAAAPESKTAEATKPAGDDAPEKPKKSGFFSFFKSKKSATAADADSSAPAPSSLRESEAAFIAECAALGAQGGTIVGADGFLFAASELASIGKGNRSTSSAVAAIADYAAQLRGLGCDIIVAPLPPRALLYPDKLIKPKGFKFGRKKAKVEAYGSSLRGALADLENRGVRTVDLTDALLGHHSDKAGPTIARTGNVLSPRGTQLAAAAVAAEIRRSKAGKNLGTTTGISMEDSTLSFTGNLAASAAEATKPESLAIRNIGRVEGDKVRSLQFKSSGGAVLLLGDSSILTWREAGNPAGASGTFASFADQLAAELQTIPDLLTTPGDGRNAPRLRILKERSAGRRTLDSAKALVWVVPATELWSTNWRKVPLQLKFNLSAPELMLR
jgi:alginate O-acetyltransferase complex protein AlgJ